VLSAFLEQLNGGTSEREATYTEMNVFEDSFYTNGFGDQLKKLLFETPGRNWQMGPPTQDLGAKSSSGPRKKRLKSIPTSMDFLGACPRKPQSKLAQV